MANKIDWIMSFIMWATLMAPRTLYEVDDVGLTDADTTETGSELTACGEVMT
ncbi:hypothetical protein GCM10027565_49570 [Bordetella tumulicola]